MCIIDLAELSLDLYCVDYNIIKKTFQCQLVVMASSTRDYYGDPTMGAPMEEEGKTHHGYVSKMYLV